MTFLESEIMEKKNQILEMYYENKDQDIMDSFIFEASDIDPSSATGFKKLVLTVQKKIDEIIQTIKKFFSDMKMRHDIKKLKEAIAKAANSQKTVNGGIDADLLCKNMDILMKKSKEVQVSINKYTNDLSTGKISASEFDNMVNSKLAELDQEANKLDTNKKKAFFTKPTSGKNVGNSAKKVSLKYEQTCDTIQQSTVSEEAKMKSMSGKSPEAAMKGANAHSKASKKIIIAMVAVAGIGLVAKRVSDVASYNANISRQEDSERHDAYMRHLENSSKLYDDHENTASERKRLEREWDHLMQEPKLNYDKLHKNIDDRRHIDSDLHSKIAAEHERFSKERDEISKKYKGKYKKFF